MMKMMKTMIVGLLLGAVLGVGVDAQTVTSYRLNIYIQGAGTPTTSFDFAAAQVTCGQARPTGGGGTVANPNQARWEDPANATLDCVWTDNGTGPLFALPFNPAVTYDSALVAVNIAGPGAESARSNPFTRPGVVPPARTNFRVR